MIKTDFLKFAAVAIFSAGLVVGCASEQAEEPAPAPEPEAAAQTGPSPEAKNAIYSAKVKQAEAARLGAEWRDTGKLIKDAEKAAAAGDNDKAIELAKQAEKQSEDAIAQHNAELARYEQMHGSVEASSNTNAGAMASVSEYRVESGDNLWNISGMDNIYGNPYQWPLIYKANSDQIKDADLIYPGQVLAIPSATTDEIDAAVQHAKTRGAWSVGTVEESDRAYLAR
jgi:nucleoid-associated protein YgaU